MEDYINIDLESMEDDYSHDFNLDESILDKIDRKEKEVLARLNKAPEYLILDEMSYQQLKYERGTNKHFTRYHGYNIAVTYEKFKQIIKFI